VPEPAASTTRIPGFNQGLYPQLPEAVQELFPFKPNIFTIGGQRMHYVDEGSGHPIILLHGNPTWSFYYRRLIKDLSSEYRVIAPDHIGCGLSEKPQDYPYTLDTHICNLEKLADHLQLKRFTLGVHDWGGAIGFGYGLRHPGRVERFIVFNSAAFRGPVPRRILACRIPWWGSLLVRLFNGFARSAILMACKNRQCMTPAVKAGYLWPYDSFRSRVAIHRFVQDIPTSTSHPSYELLLQIEDSLQQHQNKPMLICWGMQDFCFNDFFLEGWAQRFPNASIHRFLSAGHYVVEDAYDEISPLVRGFLAESSE